MNDPLLKLLPLKAVIGQFGLGARKSLGQHFLLDGAITDKVAAYAGNLTQHHIIEIGPGPGGLTRSLLLGGAKHVTAIEKDDRCIAALEQIKQAAPDRLQILHDDALNFDMMTQIPAPRKIVANLPYNVGTAMLINWLNDISLHGKKAFDSLTLMFQKEVAKRIVATPGNKDFGRLSVLSQWLCHVDYCFELPPEAFSPPPKVSSAVITLTPRTEKLVDVRQDILEMIVGKAFGQRRKMLRSALKGLPITADILLEKAGIDPTKRAEQLSVEALCGLALTYQKALES